MSCSLKTFRCTGIWAGGRLSDLEGAQINYAAPELRVSGGVLASNGVLHPGVLSAVTWARRQVARLSSA